MLNPSDIYTSVGSNYIYGCWTTPVTKFDTSSFYNWEQDNLPVLDLEERTHLLWERLGHPTSSTNGFALVVSADAISSCNSNIYKSLSACLNALPEVINAPYLIEVGSYGAIGSIVLSNKIFGPNGSIEIINRNFSKPLPFIWDGTGSTFKNLNSEFPRSTSQYALASSIGLSVTSVASQFAGGTALPTVLSDLKLSKVYSINTTVASSVTYDPRINNNFTIFTRRPLAYHNNRLTASLAKTNTTTSPFTAFNDSSAIARFTPYENSIASYESTQLDQYDASTINEIDSTEIVWKSTDFTDPTVALAYTNRLDSIKIYNCNGPIFIRNFTVDGEGYGGREYGIDIRNSSVTLENCSVARCNKAGLYASNSNIILTRGFVAYRNYGFDNTSTRIGKPWLQKVNSQNSRNNKIGTAAGIELVNSELNFSSTYSRDFTYYLSSLYYSYSLTGTNVASATPASYWLFCLSRNDIGLKAINSRIQGGKNEFTTSSFPTGIKEAHNIICELNTEAGVLLENSKMEHSGKLNFYGNFRGLEAYNSKISLDSLNCRYNQKEGLLLVDSYLNYNKDCYQPELAYGTNVYKLHNMSFFLNGTHVKLADSVLEPTNVSSMPSNYERVVMSGSFGVDFKDPTNSTQNSILPSVIVNSNSRLRLVSPAIENSTNYVDEQKALFGAAIYANDNSEVITQGTSAYVTKIVGPDGYSYQNNKAGIYANNNSTIKVQGPTIIGKYGVDLYVNNASNLEITPHKTADGLIDASGFNLATKGNHTTVELHSTRACIVADNNSNILMKDVGDYRLFWSAGAYGSAILASGLDYATDGTSLNSRLYTSAGSIQFYPNPNDAESYTASPAHGVANPTNLGIYDSNNDSKDNLYLDINYIHPQGANIGNFSNNYTFSSITNGGFCVRALNGSIVNVKNVHFPCGWWNASSVIYDSSAADNNCSKLFIWNIGDNSKLNADYVIVSGLHPADVAYHGPIGVWTSGAGITLSSYPSSTPDTSSISVLDYFGITQASAHRYANTVTKNQGPFRLYFSVDPVVNWLAPTATFASADTGYVRQVFSQGYHYSGVVAFPSSIISTYKSVFAPSAGLSGTLNYNFIYASAVLNSPNTIKAFLDDSASNSFANAKHNSVGKSGLGKLVTIYFPYNGVFGGESSDSTYYNKGRGIKSINTFDLERDN